MPDLTREHIAALRERNRTHTGLWSTDVAGLLTQYEGLRDEAEKLRADLALANKSVDAIARIANALDIEHKPCRGGSPGGVADEVVRVVAEWDAMRGAVAAPMPDYYAVAHRECGCFVASVPVTSDSIDGARATWGQWYDDGLVISRCQPYQFARVQGERCGAHSAPVAAEAKSAVEAPDA